MGDACASCWSARQGYAIQTVTGTINHDVMQRDMHTLQYVLSPLLLGSPSGLLLLLGVLASLSVSKIAIGFLSGSFFPSSIW